VHERSSARDPSGQSEATMKASLPRPAPPPAGAPPSGDIRPVFYAGDQRSAGDFVEDVLVRYTVSSR
jgi:hypothetical protein